MSQGGYLNQKPRSPASLAVVIAVHATVLTALALSKMEMPAEIFTPLTVRNIPNPPPPPKVPPEPKQAKALPKSRIDAVRPTVPTPPRPTDIVLERQPDIAIFDPGVAGTADRPVDAPKPLPVPEPVRTEAQIDPRGSLQPDYPALEQRAQNEGSVTVRLLIGTDGRVKSVERVRAASEAFWRTTERHALRHWRFRPATIDGRPVESRKTLTVHFRLDG